LEQYLVELSKQLQKHFDNPARFNYSVGDSSFDTWLDGYTPGAPGRKVSIYTEGCLLAFVTDMKIREATKDQYGIQEVMKQLYFNFAEKGMGYTWQDYQQTLENVSGISFKDFFDRFVFGTEPYGSILVEACTYFGLEIHQVPSTSYAEAKLGIKVLPKGPDAQVVAIYPGSPADNGGLALNDEIIAVDNMRLQNNLDQWLTYSEEGMKTVLVNRGGRLLKKALPEVDRFFYQTHSIKKLDFLDKHQRKALRYWANLLID
jgi:predicted metalloprotease with PDZ domain